MKLFLLGGFCLALACPLLGQTTALPTAPDSVFYLNEVFLGETDNRSKAEGYRLKTPFTPQLHTQKVFYLQSATPMAEYICFDTLLQNSETGVQAVFNIRHGLYEEWYLDGQKRLSCTYFHSRLDGAFKVFYPGGVLKRAEKWRHGKWVEGACFDEQGKEVPYCSYWQQPEFVGGLPALYRYLAAELRYPPKARKKNIEGTVYVRFIVEKNGAISEIELLRSVQKDLDEEALRVVGNMPDWQPGKKEGTPVRVQFTLPLKFKLE